MFVYWIVAIIGILNLITLFLIYRTERMELERIKEFKNMYRREIENIESIHDDNNDKIDDLSKKITDIDPILESVILQRKLFNDTDWSLTFDNISDSNDNIEEDIIVTDLNTDVSDLSG